MALTTIRVCDSQASVDLRRLMPLLVLVLSFASPLTAQANWISRVRNEVAANHLQGAADIVNARLEEDPDDLEAQTWRARILSWTGRLPESELAYRSVLRQVPNDVDVLLGLSDVLFWEEKLEGSSEVLNQVEQLPHSTADVEQRRSRLQLAMRATNSGMIPQPVPSSTEQPGRDMYRYSLNIGTESDLFSYGSAAQLQALGLGVNWSRRWSSQFSTASYRRLGQSAEYFLSGATYHFTGSQSIAISFGEGTHQHIAPVRQLSADYDGGTRRHFGPVQGIEFVGHSAAIWFVGSQVTVLGGSAIAYLPRDWRCIISGNGAQAKFDGLPPAWTPSFSTKLSAPLLSRMRVELGYGMGAENYSTLDQIGRISARTYTGAGHYALAKTEEFLVFAAYQQRSHGLTEMSIGGGYGIHF